MKQASERGPSRSGRPLLVADDFGMSPEIDAAIIELAVRGRLSGTSALVTMERWPEAAERLAGLHPSIAVGLHLNLTEGRPVGSMPKLAPTGDLPNLASVIQQCLTGRVPVDEIAAEFARQIERFRAVTGRMPDMIDGHQHVHAFPAVRRATLAATERFHWTRPPLVRVPAGGLSGAARIEPLVKSMTIGWLTSGFRSAVITRGLPVNDSFGGVANLSQTHDLLGFFDTILSRQSSARLLVMCHPGASRNDGDLAERRFAEFEALTKLDDLPDRIWRPQRCKASGAVDWSTWDADYANRGAA